MQLALVRHFLRQCLRKYRHYCYHQLLHAWKTMLIKSKIRPCYSSFERWSNCPERGWIFAFLKNNFNLEPHPSSAEIWEVCADSNRYLAMLKLRFLLEMLVPWSAAFVWVGRNKVFVSLPLPLSCKKRNTLKKRRLAIWKELRHTRSLTWCVQQIKPYIHYNILNVHSLLKNEN